MSFAHEAGHIGEANVLLLLVGAGSYLHDTEGVLELLDRRDAQFLIAVEEGALAFDGGVTLVDAGGVDDAQDQLLVDGQAHRRHHQRVAVDKVHRAVDRVHDPGWVVGQGRQRKFLHTEQEVLH